MKKSIQENDLVTVENPRYSTISNTYRVVKKFDEECVLAHPLAPELMFFKSDEELNNVQGNLPDSLERCMRFAKTNSEELSPSSRSDLEAMIYFFVVKKTFTMKQRTDLMSICGRIASSLLQNNVQAACKLILDEKAILDDFNIAQFNNIEKIIKDPTLLKHKSERFTIFNLTGFLLAQESKLIMAKENR